MSPTAKKPPFIRKLLHRCETEGNIFFIDPQNTTLGIFDPTVAKQINSDNYNDLTIPEKLSDQIKGQIGCPFSWATIRDAWQKAMQHPLQANELTKLTEHMSQLIDKQLSKEINLVSLSQEVIAQSLLPIIITNLSNKQIKSLLQDQQNKIKHFTIENPQPETFWQSLLSAFIQIRAANSVRQELRDRNKQIKPRQNDLLDPIVDMLPHLGIDRAIDAGTMILTAISGPPGAAASCLLYELCVKENWKHKLQEELTHIELSTLLKSPTKAAPITYRFVKEVLRKWSPPVITNREVRTDIDINIGNEKQTLKEGQQYVFSAYFIHHNTEYWPEPDRFDPDRWLPGAKNGPLKRGSYIPFGWSPKSCVGQTLGTYQLIIFTYLMCTQYHIQIDKPDNIEMVLAAMPLPLHFNGQINKR
ncbi:cytochrome P450 [uncultured Shewanella sp.]|uniref:cytochrome P450 n=1 Tax=uncultured Shewanella sp. TaxID=173975 RepID=UPI00262E6A45|nr:cytochrome P450 [uncultured Shewanella sp.]